MFKILLSYFFILTTSTFALADVPPARPPQTNPNPPQTSIDKNRVIFAQQAIKIFFQSKIKLPTKSMGLFGSKLRDKNLSCIKNIQCYQQDHVFMNELKAFHRDHGKITKIKFSHIIPWSFKNFKAGSGHILNKKTKSKKMFVRPPVLKPDEYMIHSYIQFSKHDLSWYHFNVIVSEDKKGNMILRHFYTTPIPSEGKLPPGVKC